MTKIKEKLIKFWAWLRKTVINKDMLLAVLLAEFVFWLPCIVIAVLAITTTPWLWAIFTAIILFWCAPFTPGWAIQIGLALIIKRFITHLDKKQAQKKANKEALEKENAEGIEQ
jgi:hypothetical protein